MGKKVRCCNTEGELYWADDSGVFNPDRPDRNSSDIAERKRIWRLGYYEIDDDLY